MSNESQPDEEQRPSNRLLHRLQAGDSDALAILFEAHGAVVRRTIRRVVRREDVADDLTQETFLRALKHAHQWQEGHGCADQWLHGIAKHCALDYCKSAAHRLSTSFSVSEEFLGRSSAVELGLLDAERRKVLEEAIRRLDIGQQQVIALAYYRGLSQAAIAEELKQPLGTIKGRMRSALQRLRGDIDPTIM